MGQAGSGKGLLLATNPDVVRDVAKGAVAAVEVEDGTKLVFQVVTTARLKTNAVKVEPSSPEETRPSVDVTIKEASSVVAEREVDLVLNIEIDDTENTTRGQEGSDRVDNRVVVGLVKVSFNELRVKLG